MCALVLASEAPPIARAFMEPRVQESPPRALPAALAPRSSHSCLPSTAHDVTAHASEKAGATLTPAQLENPRPQKRCRHGGVKSQRVPNRYYERRSVAACRMPWRGSVPNSMINVPMGAVAHSRRARVAEALTALRSVLFPVDDDAAAAGKRRPPTELVRSQHHAAPAQLCRLCNMCCALRQEVLSAAVDALKHAKTKRRADEELLVAMQLIAGDTAQPECVTSLPETKWEQVGRISGAVSWYALRRQCCVRPSRRIVPQRSGARVSAGTSPLHVRHRVRSGHQSHSTRTAKNTASDWQGADIRLGLQPVVCGCSRLDSATA